MKMCHGFLLAFIIAVCVLVYKITPTDLSDRPKQPISSWRSTILTGYKDIVENQSLQMHCNTCSLVTSSGHLTGSKRGREIDRADCVIRMNDAPTKGHETDVGLRTSIRVVAHSSTDQVLRNQNFLQRDQGALFVFWGPSVLMNPRGKLYKRLQKVKRALPELNFYIVSQEKMQKLDEVFKKETGRDRQASRSWLSTGWFTMVLSIELCDQIDVYGMVSPGHCLNSTHSVPYHYYGPAKFPECSMYLSHENGKLGGHHRYITEKRVFANWARTFGIHFHQPEWTPSPSIQNNTRAPFS